MSEQNGTFRVPTEEEEDDNIIFRCISNLRAVTTALGKRILGDKALTAQEEIRQKRCNVVPDRPNYDQSSWGRMLKDPLLLGVDSKAAKLFRRRFRLPYSIGSRRVAWHSKFSHKHIFQVFLIIFWEVQLSILVLCILISNS